MTLKIPISVLVLIHSHDLQVLLLERTDYPGGWQSVTGSLELGETMGEAASREVFEETGLRVGYGAEGLDGEMHDWFWANQYRILPRFQHRYPGEVHYNTEHVYSVSLPKPRMVMLCAAEHTAQAWLPWEEAATRVFSPSNRQAILALPRYLNRYPL